MAKPDKTKTEKAELERLCAHVFSLLPSEYVYGSGGPYAGYREAGAAVDAMYRRLMDEVENNPVLHALRKKREALLVKGRKEVRGYQARMLKLKTSLLAGRDLDKVRAELLKIADAVSAE